jgi:hypothetical protein
MRARSSWFFAVNALILSPSEFLPNDQDNILGNQASSDRKVFGLTVVN